jgi:RNA polymerase-binding transcription factor DksA
LTEAIMPGPTAQPASPFTAAELARWRDRLAASRERIRGALTMLHDDAQAGDHVSLSSNHLAEGAADAQEQDISAVTATEEGAQLALIERALRKIDTGRPLPFGLCEWSERPIAAERLELMPWTPLSAEGAEHMEEEHLTIDDLMAED